MCSLASVIFLGKLLISEKFGVHSSGRHILGALGLLDAIGVRLVRRVVCASILLLSFSTRGRM
jgi:hypothetical protein